MTTARKAARERDARLARLAAPRPQPLAQPNRWPGTCETCKTRVGGGKGRLARTRSGDLVIVCSECAET